jgi:hypothetical protein
MNNKNLLVGLLVVGTLVLVPLFMYVGYNNQEVRLRHQIEAQQKKNEVVFDNTWKIIQQQAGVSSEYKDSFRQIYSDIMAGRYSNGAEKNGQSMMLWVKEHNPKFDSSLFKKLMTSIEAQRTVFTREQEKLLDLKREHDNLLTVMPSSWFVGGRQAIDVKLVTSGKTNTSFATGEDNDVDLFKKTPTQNK